MMKPTMPKLLTSVVLFALALGAAPARAASADHGLLQQRVKIVLNEMVAEVRASESADAKRAVLERFIDKFENRARLAERLPLDDEHRAALASLQARFAGYNHELRGGDDLPGVADGDLDAFAGFMQQDLEQAASASWGSGGIYLSTGAVIIILLILILIT